VVAATGVRNQATVEDLRRIIRLAGFTPLQRDTLYRTFYPG